MKKQISPELALTLSVLKNELLMTSANALLAIKDYIIEEGVEKTWWGKEVKRQYLTKIEIAAYDTRKKYGGYLTDEAAMQLLIFVDLNACRKRWCALKEQLAYFGLEINAKNE